MISERTLSLRHPTEAALISRALEGDAQAAGLVLLHISSPYPGLLQKILDTIRDLAGDRLWLHMVNCLALQQWDEQTPADLGDAEAYLRLNQAIIELFIQDENDDEKYRKDAFLLAALQHTDPRIRQSAAILAGLRGQPAAIEPLINILQQGEQPWRLRAARALGNIKDQRCGFPLVWAIASAHNLFHKEARESLIALGELSIPAWVDALEHPDPHIRWHAARALGELGDVRSANILAQGLFDENSSVRWISATVLAGLGAAAVPTVLEALGKQKLNEASRQAAFHAIHSLKHPRLKERLKPLNNALSSPNTRLIAQTVARQLLAEWFTTS